MIISILVFALEILYFYIIFKNFNINDKIKRIILFISIGFIIVLSGIILNSSIFRYIFLPIAFWTIIKILNKENRIAYSITIVLILFIKFMIEFVTVIIFMNKIDIMYISIIFEVFSVIFAIFIKKYIKIINKKLLKLWDGSKNFYIRYSFLIVINIFILFTIYNLIKMKEVF